MLSSIKARLPEREGESPERCQNSGRPRTSTCWSAPAFTRGNRIHGLLISLPPFFERFQEPCRTVSEERGRLASEGASANAGYCTSQPRKQALKWVFWRRQSAGKASAWGGEGHGETRGGEDKEAREAQSQRSSRTFPTDGFHGASLLCLYLLITTLRLTSHFLFPHRCQRY